MLKKIEVYEDKTKKFTTIDLNSPVIILTGINGIGKTRFVHEIHSAISAYCQIPFVNQYSDFSVFLEFENGFHILFSKIESNFYENIKLNNKKISDILAGDKKGITKKIFDFLKSEINKIKNVSINLMQSSSDNTSINKQNSNKSIQMCLSPGNSDYKISSILYAEDEFFYSNKKKNVDMAKMDFISKNKSINKSTFLLIDDFIAKINSEDKNNLMERNSIMLRIKEIISEKDFEKIKSEIELNKNEEIKILDVINSFLSKSDKSINIDGISLSINTDFGPIKWYELSRGEKTLLNLIMSVYINNDKNTLFLFDEPEISLHIDWQKKLIPVLRDIAPESQFIITTHSPALVGYTDGEKIISMKDLYHG